METITLELDNSPDLRFTGELIASAASEEQAGRCTELALYRTRGAVYICHHIGRTRLAGERDRFSGKVCENLDEVPLLRPPLAGKRALPQRRHR